MQTINAFGPVILGFLSSAIGSALLAYMFIRLRIQKMEGKQEESDRDQLRLEASIKSIKSDVRDLFVKRQADREELVEIKTELKTMDGKIDRIVNLLTHERKVV